MYQKINGSYKYKKQTKLFKTLHTLTHNLTNSIMMLQSILSNADVSKQK
jgi:hypothetical protein